MKKPRQGKRSGPTIIDVAREAQVGVMTVSRVINNYKTVRPTTYAKVMKAIAKVGYRPNDAARMLKGMKARTIGLIIPDLSDFFSSCFHAVQSVAIRHDYQTLVVATGRSASVEDQQLQSIGSHRIAGLILVSSGGDVRQLQALRPRSAAKPRINSTPTARLSGTSPLPSWKGSRANAPSRSARGRRCTGA